MSVRILIGDVLDRLAALPDESVHCVVSSPPYWGLRDYGVAGQIGLEPTLGEHLEMMVKVFREVRRVMRPDATLWINYGDCYATSPNGRSAADTKAAGNDDRTFRDKPFSTVGPIYSKSKRIDRGGGRWGGGNNSDPTLKPKDLCMVPNRLAIALQEDGWWIRSEIIWAKPNPMPESITDRPATAHEKIWLLSKSARYTYDADAVRMAAVGKTEHDLTGSGYSAPGQSPQTGNRQRYKMPDGWDTEPGGHGSFHRNGREKGQPKKPRHEDPRHVGRTQHETLDAAPRGNGRNLRNYEPAPIEVWNIATAAYSDAHFATFPPALVERCIMAGCPEGGVVLDPFGGAGTTGLVADRMGRDAILIELNPDYAELARVRIAGDDPLFGLVTMEPPDPGPDPDPIAAARP